MKCLTRWLSTSILAVAVACSDDGSDGGGPDAGGEPTDLGSVIPDADPNLDAGPHDISSRDVGSAPDLGAPDAGEDAGLDAGADGGTDAGLPAEDMVEVPAGPYLQGCNTTVGEVCFGPLPDGDVGMAGELPTTEVTLPAFLIDRTEVTGAAYQMCVEAGACTPASRTSLPTHPVTDVDWFQAEAFCSWRGARLPAEQEWEKAARGTEGFIWPTGNTTPGCDEANILIGAVRCNEGTWPAGSRPAGASPFGALDMAGNVVEWTATEVGLSFPDLRVMRSSFWNRPASVARSSVRYFNETSFRGNTIGFRCARDPR